MLPLAIFASIPLSCPDLPAPGEESQNHAILIGYPYASPGNNLVELMETNSDVMKMAIFLEPHLSDPPIVHLSGAAHSIFPSQHKAPNKAALAKSFAEILGRIRLAQLPQNVYVYYAGHGVAASNGDSTKLLMFLEDGELHSDELIEMIAPLEKYAKVHVIVDACDSIAFLARGGDVKKPIQRIRKIPTDNEYQRVISAFARSYPRIGLSLATDRLQVTKESSETGGKFTYALLSAASGLADIDRNGIITYREINSAVWQILKDEQWPFFMGPEEDDSTPFIDHRGKPLARICFEAEDTARYELSVANMPFLLFYTDLSPSHLLLPFDRTYRVITRTTEDDTAEVRRFRPITGNWHQQDLVEDWGRLRGLAPFKSEGLLPQPFTPDYLADLKNETQKFLPGRYYRISLEGWVQSFITKGPGNLGRLYGGNLDIWAGVGRHALRLGVGLGQGRGESHIVVERFTADVIDGALGYRFIFAENRGDFALNLGFSAGIIRQRLDSGVTHLAWSGSLLTDVEGRFPFSPEGRTAMFVRLGPRWHLLEAWGDSVYSNIILDFRLGWDWEGPW